MGTFCQKYNALAIANSQQNISSFKMLFRVVLPLLLLASFASGLSVYNRTAAIVKELSKRKVKQTWCYLHFWCNFHSQL